jgi:hypothetical protein
MATAFWVIYDIMLFVVGFWFMERELTRKERVVIAGLAVMGLAVAGFSAYSGQQDDNLISSLRDGQEFTKGQLDAIGAILGNKLSLSPDTNAAVIANAAANKIDALEASLRQHEWPLMKSPETLGLVLKTIDGPHRLSIDCNDDDCMALADEIDNTAKAAGWDSRVVVGTIDGIGNGLWFYGPSQLKSATDRLGEALRTATGFPVETGNSGDEFFIVVGRKPRS